MKKMNIDEVIKYHCQTKKVLTDIYNHLKKEIEYKEQLMKKIKPLIEHSEIKNI
tara:strand:+ start:730 stop:891 length:162 start_codon:yes stop_codon:yes gene_type:complete